MAVSGRGVVLSLRAAGLGDLLTAVPALRAVRAAQPDAWHVLATTRSLAPLAALIGATDAVVPAAVAHDGEPIPVTEHPDLAVNLHGCGPESHRLLQATGARRLVAFRNERAVCDGPQWDPHEHEVDRWCRLVAQAGMPADADDLDVAPPPGAVPPGVRGATVLHPGAAWPARRWPVERWVALATAEASEGHRVVVTAGPGEADVVHAVGVAVPRAVTLDCSADVGLLFRTVADARAVVCTDTGVAHVATAVRAPSVVLFGPESPARWGPPADRPWHEALWAGRSGDPHGGVVDPGLLELDVVDVLLALHRVRARAGRSAGNEKATCAS